ncbi:hypothetical protein B9Z19DRAFT_484257 [Tuber borchii]|uniref:Uncharacterized protein n=1 Tax=Tuber borchii TaxID=42251 RepID=A0A2T6ZF44_TUBBO|nr:hypothetical protein B9Z19DRAFT_484257 [Tuber borchii]
MPLYFLALSGFNLALSRSYSLFVCLCIFLINVLGIRVVYPSIYLSYRIVSELVRKCTFFPLPSAFFFSFFPTKKYLLSSTCRVEVGYFFFFSFFSSLPFTIYFARTSFAVD